VRRLVVAALVIAALAGTTVLAAGCGTTSSGEPSGTSSGSSTSTPAPGADIGAAFAAFARGDGELPPVAGQVDIYVGNAFTGFVTRQSGRQRDAWETCTEIGRYAGRACPFSALEVLAEHPDVEAADVEAAEELGRGCLARFGPLPPRLTRSDSVALVPAGQIDCADDFAVQLFTDEEGTLTAVALLLGRRAG
jgi:hypothetical protein